VPPKAANYRNFKGFGVGIMKINTKNVRPRRFTGFAFATFVGITAAVGFFAIPAQAADDDEVELLDTKILRGVLKGLGLKRDGEAIDYRERSPLVLPPSKELNQLPPPEAVNAKKSPDWPDDPDIKRARQQREAQRKRKPFEPGVDDKPLPPNKMTAEGQTPATTGSKAGEAPGRSIEGGAAPSTNSELGSKGMMSMFSGLWAPKEEYTAFTGEPQRGSLTEPPPGYRTPSPNQPYGVGREKWKPTVVDRNEPVK
jgi:hypothetical protein